MRLILVHLEGLSYNIQQFVRTVVFGIHEKLPDNDAAKLVIFHILAFLANHLRAVPISFPVMVH